MCVLSQKTIIELCRNKKHCLIEPWVEKNVKGSSYDLRVGSEFLLSSKEIVKITELKPDEKFLIPPHKVCFILSEEKLNLPNDVTAIVTLMSELIQQGIVLSAQPPIDPGYHGKIFALVHNLSHEKVQLQRGKPFLSVVFYKLDKKVDPYTGEYQGMASLNKLAYIRPYESGLAELETRIVEFERKTEEALKKYEAMLPHTIQIIVITVAVLTIIFAAFSAAGLLIPSLKSIFP